MNPGTFPALRWTPFLQLAGEKGSLLPGETCADWGQEEGPLGSPAVPGFRQAWRAAPGLRCPALPPAEPLPAPGSASTAPALSAPSPGCPATMFSLFRAQTLSLLPAWGLASGPPKPLKPSASRFPWASMTKLGEAVASMGDGKIITRHLLQAPRPSLPISNT